MTAPYFCASPDISSTDTPLPSRCAAMARIWPMVITPVPPMPVTSTPYCPASSRGAGSVRAGKSSADFAAERPFFRRPPSTVTKLGQDPLRQEKCLLHEDWLTARLRPNSVSSGSTERQFDSTLQSPQPSHTLSLVTSRLAG